MPVHSNQGEALRAAVRREAEQAFREALRLNPDLSQALNNLGNLLRLLGRATRQRSYLKRAIELQPSADSHYNLGLLLAAEGEVDEAVKHFRRAVELNGILPTPGTIWGAPANARRRGGRHALLRADAALDAPIGRSPLQPGQRV